MARYIDADALDRDGWLATRTYPEDNRTIVYETKKLTGFPIADVRQNVHAVWVDTKCENKDNLLPRMKCSMCGFQHNRWFRSIFKWCPNCGADMREGDAQ